MNQKGQAFIEVVILSSILMISIILIVRLGLILYLNIALDEVIETTHLCELQNKSDCHHDFHTRLKALSFKTIRAHRSRTAEASYLIVTAESNLGKIFEKESELHLELTIP